jgi:hypothetical protein
MKGKELSDELEHIVKYLCEVANKQDTYALEIVDEVKKELEKLDYYRQDRGVVGDFEKGTTKLWWENILIIVDDKTKEIWQYWEGTLEDKTITLNDCLEIAKKELDYECGIMIIICESYLSGIIYRYGNYPNCNDFEIAGKMHGFA